MITVRISKPLLKDNADPAVLDRLTPWLNAIVPLAAAIKARVQGRGEVVGTQPHYSTVKGYSTNVEYAQKAGAPGKGTWYGSSQAFHTAAGKRPGTGDTTGEMWKGFQVRNYGQNGVIIDFAGSSLGRSSQATGDTYKTKTGREKVRKEAQVIGNDLKAVSMWRSWQVNVTQPSDHEEDSLHAAVIFQAQNALKHCFNLPDNWTPGYVGDPTLYKSIAQAWVKP